MEPDGNKTFGTVGKLIKLRFCEIFNSCRKTWAAEFFKVKCIVKKWSEEVHCTGCLITRNSETGVAAADNILSFLGALYRFVCMKYMAGAKTLAEIIEFDG